MATRSDIDVFYNLSPRLVRIAAPSTEVTIQDLHDTLRDIEDEPANLIYPDLIESAGKEPLGGNVFVGLTATLQNAQIMFERRVNLLSSGTITTASTSSERAYLLIDSAATFITDGVKRGDIVHNETDIAYGEVLTVDSETQLTVLKTGGGTDNELNLNDTYYIYEMVQCEISGGNLVAIDGLGDPISPVFPTFGTQVLRTSSSSATLQEQADIQYASFNGGVTIDILNGTAGTIFPIGTPRLPVNNFADALSILQQRGFDTYFVRGDLTINAGTHPYLFIGQAISVTTITIDAIADVTGARFENATITGTLDGDAGISNCDILNLNFFNGVINSCVLEGVITLGGGVDALILDCWGGSQGATINLGGTGQQLYLQNFSGSVEITNKTGTDDVTIGLANGRITIDNTVTNGQIALQGVGKWTNRTSYAGGATIINELIDADDIQQTAFENFVTIDVINGVAGITYPTGTALHPVNNISDAIAISNIHGFNKIRIIGNITLDTGDNLSGYQIFGQNTELSTITINAGASVTSCEFSECTLTGVLDGNNIIRESIVDNISEFNGVMFNCLIFSTVTLGGGSQASFLNCYSGVAGGAITPTINMGGSGQKMIVRNYAGGIKLTNRTGTDSVSIDLNSGQVIIDDTVTNGEITLRGVGKWTNEDVYIGGATIKNELLATGTIVQAFDDNTYDGVPLSVLLQDLLSMAKGRIVENPSNTFTFYEQDNQTPRFVLVKTPTERKRL
jgi:hypothetical protein